MTITVDLPDDALARLQAEAARRGISIDSVIAELTTPLPMWPPPTRRALSFIGLGTSTIGLSAQNANEILGEGFCRD